MSKTGIFFGSTTGNTETAATAIESQLSDAVSYNISESSVDEIESYDSLIFGSSTWGLGELQDDWDMFIGKLKGANLSGKKVAFFGTGDQLSYSDTFVDAMGLIYEAIKDSGAKFIGRWPSDDYDYSDSKSEIDGMFIGLALDEDNQSDKTDERIEAWVSQIEKELKDQT